MEKITNPKFQIFRGKDDQFYFRLNARNGEIVLSSEGYVNMANCSAGVDSVKVNAANLALFVKGISRSGRPFFNLTASNGQVIGTSQMYSSEAACEKGIEAVHTIAPHSLIEVDI